MILKLLWTMATLSILVEAAKLIECNEELYKSRRKIVLADELRKTPKPGGCRTQTPPKKNVPVARFDDARRGNRLTHNILEKNRRADMKNYFQILKSNLPKLKDQIKASNVNILTDAVKYIQELTEDDRNYQLEKAVLRQCQTNLEDRIKILKEEIRRQHFCARLFQQVQDEKKRMRNTTTSNTAMTSPEMAHVEIQANEHDIKTNGDVTDDVTDDASEREEYDDLSYVHVPRDVLSDDVMMSVETQANEKDIKDETETELNERHGGTNVKRTCFSDVRQNDSLNPIYSNLPTLSYNATTSKGIGNESREDVMPQLTSIFSSLVAERSLADNSVGVQCKIPKVSSNVVQCNVIPKVNSKATNRRKRKIVPGNDVEDDDDSESELKIVLEEDF